METEANRRKTDKIGFYRELPPEFGAFPQSTQVFRPFLSRTQTLRKRSRVADRYKFVATLRSIKYHLG